MKKRKFIILSFFFLFLTELSFSQQNLQVSGTVTSGVDKEPLVGVSVSLKGTQTGTMTDLDGKYSISAPREATLVFSYLGMITQELTVNNRAVLDVILKEDNQFLDEVVVIGYGTQKKSDVTGAISSIKMGEISKLPVPNIDQALQGAAAGIQVVNKGGQPGAGTMVRIRGISSINKAEPMWIVDGVRSSANAVNASDIESIEVLKDASTAAIYGSDGANGVILITTKRGKQGILTASLNAYYGIQNVIKTLDMTDGPGYANYINETELLTGVRANRLSFPDPSVIAGLPTYDYQKESFRQANTQNYEFSASSGSEKGNAYFGLGYQDQEGIIQGSDYMKFNVLLNSEFKLRPWFTVGEQATFIRSIRDGYPDWKFLSEYESPLMNAALYSPYQDDIIVDEKGKEQWTGDRNGRMSPSAVLATRANEHSENYSGSATLFAKIEPFKNFVFETKLTGNIGLSEFRSFADKYKVLNSTAANERTSLTRNYRKDSGWNWQNYINYHTTIANDFNLAAMIGMESQSGYWHGIGGTRYDLISSDPNMWYFDSSLDNSSVSQIVNGGAEEWSKYSYFGRITADYKSKYLAQLIFRRDGSSQFGPKNRYGNFPSGSIGWKFSEEAFMQGIDWLSFGKLRVGVGTSGNSTALGNYEYYALAAAQGMYQYSFTNNPIASIGAAPTMLANKAIHWEKIVTSNYGVDLGFFNNKLNMTFDYFTRETQKMLLRVPVPDLAGWYVFDSYHEGGSSVANSNVGNIRNSGVELTAGWKSMVNKDFSYGIDANFTYVKNKAVDLKETVLYDGTCRGISGNLTRTVEGGSLGEFYGYKTLGIFQESDGSYIIDKYGEKIWTMTNQPYTTDASGNKVYAQPNAAPGDYIFLDANGDGTVNDDDKVNLGNPHPKYLFGVTFNISYKLLDFSMFWYGSLGNKIFNGVNAFVLSEGTGGNRNLPQTFIDGHWRPDIWAKNQNPDTDAPMYPAHKEGATWARYDIANANGNFNKMSDVFIEDGSYIKLQNIQVGCHLPQQWLKPTTLGDVRFYLGLYNVLTITKYTGMDPELNNASPLASNIDKAGYPISRTFTLGCSVKF